MELLKMLNGEDQILNRNLFELRWTRLLCFMLEGGPLQSLEFFGCFRLSFLNFLHLLHFHQQTGVFPQFQKQHWVLKNILKGPWFHSWFEDSQQNKWNRQCFQIHRYFPLFMKQKDEPISIFLLILLIQKHGQQLHVQSYHVQKVIYVGHLLVAQ